jgi:hypothetical protein
VTVQHVVRPKTANDDVLSPGQAAKVMPMSRQGITKAIAAGRIPGFQEPGRKGRWWAERRYVEAQAGSPAMGGDDATDSASVLSDRIDALEVLVAGLAESVKKIVDASAGAGEVERVRSDLQTRLNNANAVIVELNAAARPAQDAATARQDAVSAMATAIDALQRLASGQASEIDLLRNAIAQTSVPDSLA